MKKKSNYRTPKRLLSLVLSSLLLLSCFSVLSGVFVLEAGAADSTAVSSYHCYAQNYWKDTSTLTVSGVEDGVDSIVENQEATYTHIVGAGRRVAPIEHDAAIAYKYVDYRLNKTITSLGISLNLNNINSIACGNAIGGKLYADSYGYYDLGEYAGYNYMTGLTDLTFDLYGGALPNGGTKKVNVSSYNEVWGPNYLAHDHYNSCLLYTSPSPRDS